MTTWETVLTVETETQERGGIGRRKMWVSRLGHAESRVPVEHAGALTFGFSCSEVWAGRGCWLLRASETRRGEFTGTDRGAREHRELNTAGPKLIKASALVSLRLGRKRSRPEVAEGCLWRAAPQRGGCRDTHR